jgi:hypothetical protein
MRLFRQFFRKLLGNLRHALAMGMALPAANIAMTTTLYRCMDRIHQPLRWLKCSGWQGINFAGRGWVWPLNLKPELTKRLYSAQNSERKSFKN